MTVPTPDRQHLHRRTDELTEQIATHARCYVRGADSLGAGGSEYHLKALVDLTAEYDAVMAQLEMAKPDGSAYPLGLCDQCDQPAEVHYAHGPGQPSRCWDHAPALEDAAAYGWVRSAEERDRAQGRAEDFRDGSAA